MDNAVRAVHATWRPDGLALWAEGDPREAVAPRARRPAALPHPFAVAPATIRRGLGLGPAERPHTLRLELPGSPRRPAPSTEPLPGSPGERSTWDVPVLVVAPQRAIPLLLGLSDQLAAGPGLTILAAAARFADDLARRGRVAPAVDPDGPGRARGRWRPVLTGADAAWVAAVTGVLPGCLPAETFGAAVDGLTDAAVRLRLRQRPTADRAPARTPAARLVRALAGGLDGFILTDPDRARLTAALRDWQRDLHPGGPIRLCFRLTEPPAVADDPDDDEATWRVTFALQAVEDPSLLVGAAEIWSTGAGPLARHLPEPEETLLQQLGRALRVYPELAPALRTVRPEALELDTAGALEFLATTAPVLLATGFGVQLPAWWTQPGRRLGTRLNARTPPQPGLVAARPTLGRDDLVEFSWDLALGDDVLTDHEIAELVAGHQSLVKLRGQWVHIDADRLARARKFLARRAARSGTMTLADVLATIGGLVPSPGDLPVVAVDTAGWLADFLSGDADRRITPVPTPAGFAGELRPYQQRGTSWLVFLESLGLGGILADDMGLGKTVQLLALFSRDLDDPTRRPTLLVCPMSLVGNWQREAERFVPKLRVHVHHGAERARGPAFSTAVAEADLVITTYALVARDLEALREIDWHRVVLDEAQAVKNAAARAAVAVRSLSARSRFAVTGTPVENRLADLWSLVEFANPGMLGSALAFKERFALPIERLHDDRASARLRALTGPVILRRLKTDRTIISDLPDKLEMDVVCSLTREQASLYQGVVAEMMQRIADTEGIERRGLVLATMTKLKQVCNHPAQYLGDHSPLAGRSGKLARLDETVDEILAAGDKALVFSQYAEFAAMVTEHLATRFRREVCYLHGGLRKSQRDAMVARFQDPGGPALFVLSLKAGGTGLTLTQANHVIHLDRWWNPAVEDQATDRAFRIGQTKNVQVRKFLCAGTLEEKVAAMLTDKRALADRVVGTGESWLAALSTAELRALFALEPGAVVE